MANKFITALFGDYSKKEVKRLGKTKQKVLDLEEKYQAMDDKELTAQTAVLKTRLADGETLDDILPDAFAVCREAAWRVLGMKHFPVQIIGGIVLHQGRIAEMKTGEGKTLVATLPAYLNALTGRGVHIVTVNDYLAKRDSEWMGKLYRFLGLSVGLIIHEKTNEERQEAYNCDITYGTNNEMGFDYLRDNMVQYKEQKVQRGHVFAIVDEVDSILIDEARTPLIISGKGEQSTDLYRQANAFARTLKMVKVAKMDEKQDTEATYDGDFIVDEKARTATLTQDGVKKAEAYFHVDNLMDIAKDIEANPEKYAHACEGKKLATLFYEPSTRTRLSHEAAMINLGGSVLGFSSADSSSASKGESVADTIRVISCFADICAMRHPKEGAAMVASQHATIPVINAGDGGHQHPTQTLTDMLTIRSLKGRLDNMTIGLCGDLKFGRTVHSLIHALVRYPGIRFVLISPEELKLPSYIKNDVLDRQNIPYEEVVRLEDALPDLDILYMTRVQKERFFNEEDYVRMKDFYILDNKKMELAKEDMYILHPLPRVNEIATEVDNDPRAAYFKQVQYGVYIRMALILTLLGIEV